MKITWLAVLLTPFVGATANARQLLHSVHGANTEDQMAYVSSAAGDVNGDGFGDVAFGDRYSDVLVPSGGGVRVFSGLDASLLHAWNGDAVTKGLGSAVGSVGDIDLDGRSEVAVGIVNASLGWPNSGAVRVYSGATGLVMYSWNGKAPGDQFGQAVAGVGDVTGDGIPDVAVGAPLADGAIWTNVGWVYVYSGSTGTLRYSIENPANEEALGASLAAAGDINLDGFPDFAVGSRFGTGSSSGAVRVFSGLNGQLIHHWPGTTKAKFGWAIDGGRDVDADGVPDIVAGAQGLSQAEVRSGATGTVLHTKKNPLVIVGFGQFGNSVALLDDQDGDGFADFAAGDPLDGTGPCVIIFSGQSGDVLSTHVSTGDHFGWSMARTTDLNGDGQEDFVVGAPYGKTVAHLSGTGHLFGGTCGSALNYGAGCAGTAGYVPELRMRSLCIRELYDFNIIVNLPNIFTHPPGLLFVSSAPAQTPVQPGCDLLVAPPLVGLPFKCTGGWFDASVVLPIGLSGTTLYLQAFVLDTAGPYGYFGSRGLELSIP